MNNQINDVAISDADLDAVAGGFAATEHAKISSARDLGGGSGCTNDPCERYAQILQGYMGR
jgi:hypothetical protein